MNPKINMNFKNISIKTVPVTGQGRASGHCKRAGSAGLSRPKGFTLLEVMIAVGLFSLVMAGSLGVYIMCQRLWHATTLSMETSRLASMTIERMVCGVGTNGGLRSTGMFVLQTNAFGHPYPFSDSYKYWETGAAQPSASEANQYTHVGCAYAIPYYNGPDGSWRLILSNQFDGINCFDYNAKMRSILFCPDTNQTYAARLKRILVCNYVSIARITNDAAGKTVELQVTVEKRDGMFIASNRASTVIKMRN